MYCSTCGAYVPEGRSRCSECGTSVVGARGEPKPPMRYGSEDRRWVVERAVGVCPRCSYHGEGITYFSRGSHAAALIGLTVLTAGAMGVGGLVYYLIRREHRVCPRCGKGWGRFGELSLPATGSRLAPERKEAPLPKVERASAKRFWSVLLAVVAVLLVLGGVLGGEVVPVVIGGVTAAGAWMLRKAANEEREERRAALIAQLQLPVLRLAGEKGGRLTVTEVAASLQWPMARAEKVLNSLDDGLRVNSDVTDEGVIVYEFLELMRAPDRLPRLERPGRGEPETSA